MKALTLAALLVGLIACGGDDPPVNLPDAPPADAPGAACDVLAQSGCDAGEKCARVVLQSTPTTVAEVRCVPQGTQAVDQTCAYGAAGDNGYSNCVGGTECVGGECKQICDQQGGNPKCLATHACGLYENVFQTGPQDFSAGLCDVKCDPLTQELLAGANKTACGSPTATRPEKGCYTGNRLDFTCGRVPTDAIGKTDGTPALVDGDGDAYSNACDAGYVAITFASSTAQRTICNGLCAPVSTFATSPEPKHPDGDPAASAKLPTEAATAVGNAVCQTGKKGSGGNQNCIFWWFYNITNSGEIRATDLNDKLGICFSYTNFTNINHDGNAGTPNVDWPACETLTAPGTTPAPAIGNADFWGCVPTTQLPPLQAKGQRPVNAMMKDFRISSPLPASKLARHILRQ